MTDVNTKRWNPVTITLELIPLSQARALLEIARNIPVSELSKLLPNVDPTELLNAKDELAFAIQRDLRDQGGGF